MGTVVHQRIEKRYVFPDIIQINKPYSKYEYFREKNAHRTRFRKFYHL